MSKLKIASESAVERTGNAPGDTPPTTSTHEATEFDAVRFVRLSFPDAKNIQIVEVTHAFVKCYVDDKRFNLFRGKT